MYFLADDILANAKPEHYLFHCPKYKIVMEMDKNLKFPFKDYYLPHEKFWLEVETRISVGTIRNGFYIEENEDKESFTAAWYMTTQTSHKKMMAFNLAPFDDGGRLKAKIHTTEENHALLETAGATLGNLASQIMQLIYELNRRDAVRSDIKGRKIAIEGNKRDRRKFQYTIITHKKYISKAIKTLGRKIEFEFAFPVRGHWRELPGKTGKDRKGDYCVPNKTWVSESVKGKGELLNKRVMK